MLDIANICGYIQFMDTTKQCNKCHEVKKLGEFGKDKNKNDNLCATCKQCRSEWQKANKDKLKAYQAKRYKANKENILKRNAKWYKANKEKGRARSAKYRKENKDKKKAYDAQYRDANKEKIVEQKANQYKANKAKLAARKGKSIASLSDSYIRELLGRTATMYVGTKYIPQELIELKRVQLSIARKLKEIKS